MNIIDAGLVLEGGGLRGVYTSGVLQYFMEKNLYFPYVIGVSMGACNAANYISRQPERNKIVNISFVNDPRYLSFFRLLRGGEMFGMDFIFDTIPNKLVPFDFKTFYESTITCVTTVTDCMTGEAAYYEKNELGDDYLKIVRASSSLPFIAKPVRYKERILMDGGISDSVPIRKSIADGNSKNVVILTQPAGYRKKPESLGKFVGLRYPKYKGLQSALRNRHSIYNDTMDYIDSLIEKDEVFVIRPRTALSSGRIEKNQDVLHADYNRGYEDAAGSFDRLIHFINR